MNERIVEYINILGGFCGKRDVSQLSPEELKKTYGIDQADVMVLFGGSILCGGDVLAQAMQSHAAKKYVIAGEPAIPRKRCESGSIRNSLILRRQDCRKPGALLPI